jgi:hypothetical protein
MVPTGRAYDADWVFSCNSNVHVANDRGWFDSFTAFDTNLESICLDAKPTGVVGIGQVTLPVKSHRTRTGACYQRSLVLSEVLYAPRMICNVLGGPICEDYSVVCDASGGGLRDKSTGAYVAIFDATPLLRLRLKEQTCSQSSLDPNLMHVINVRWCAEEKARWGSYEARLHSRHTSRRSTKSFASVDRYATEERRWLRDNFGGESHFLQTHGLSIYRDEDREEGRAIARALMEDSDTD